MFISLIPCLPSFLCSSSRTSPFWCVCWFTTRPVDNFSSEHWYIYALLSKALLTKHNPTHCARSITMSRIFDATQHGWCALVIKDKTKLIDSVVLVQVIWNGMYLIIWMRNSHLLYIRCLVEIEIKGLLFNIRNDNITTITLPSLIFFGSNDIISKKGPCMMVRHICYSNRMTSRMEWVIHICNSAVVTQEYRWVMTCMFSAQGKGNVFSILHMGSNSRTLNKCTCKNGDKYGCISATHFTVFIKSQ